jgi:hypothetical protein
MFGFQYSNRLGKIRGHAKTESPDLEPNKRLYTRYETSVPEMSKALCEALQKCQSPSDMVEPGLGPKFLPQEERRPQPNGTKRVGQPADESAAPKRHANDRRNSSLMSSRDRTFQTQQPVPQEEGGQTRDTEGSREYWLYNNGKYKLISRHPKSY